MGDTAGIIYPLDPLIDELGPELKAILERREKQALRWYRKELDS